jgi:hypothetical protein
MSIVDDARRKLEAEIARLETLYFVSTITYKREAKEHYRKSQGADKAIVFEAGDWKREVAHNAGHFKAIVEDVLPKTLRETIYVRVISAVEVFHVDLVRAIFTFRRDLLARNQVIELQYGYLASLTTISELITKLVDKDCRAMTSGGFEDAIKFYKQRFQIELKALSGYKQLAAAHDLRHILVHRLGFTDESYRRQYKSKKRRVAVDEAALLALLKHIRSYADALLKQVEKLTVTAPARASRDQSDLSLHVQIDSPEAAELTSPDYSFLHNERYYTLRDYIRERRVDGSEVRLMLRGDQNVLRIYLKKVKTLAKHEKLTILTPSKTRTVKLTAAPAEPPVAISLADEPARPEI